jgi:hypothetical protein
MRRAVSPIAVALLAGALAQGAADALATHVSRPPCRFRVACADGFPNALVRARCRNGWVHPRMEPWCDEVTDGVCVFKMPAKCGMMGDCYEEVTVPVYRRRVRRVTGARVVLRCRPPGPEGAPCVSVADCPPLLGSPCRECVQDACFYDSRCF